VNEEPVQEVVLRALRRIAPEADLGALEPDVSFREQLDIDSMDFLYFVAEVCEQLNVDIPEADYRRLSSLDDCVAYLKSKRGR
jgi:acyl carrier protein